MTLLAAADEFLGRSPTITIQLHAAWPDCPHVRSFSATSANYRK